MANSTNNNTPKDKGINWVGALLLFAIVSIAYSTDVVYFGTTGWKPKVALIPQVILGLWIAIVKFTKN